MVELKAAIKRERPDDIIMEESPVGESKSNGSIENGIKIVQ